MQQINVAAMQEVCKTLYTTRLIAAYGAGAVGALKEILEFLGKFYQHIDPGASKDSIIVFRRLDTTKPPSAGALKCKTFGELTQAFQAPATIELLPDGAFALIQSSAPKPDKLAQSAVVYEYRKQTEVFYAKTDVVVVPKVVQGISSMFAIPTFTELSTALHEYGTKNVRYSSCPVFRKVWSDKCRLFFRPKPEAIMRESLYNFLRIVLRGAEVRQEQNVDETHPVDIKVTWWASTKLALIEIKWLGRCHQGTKLGTSYSAVRARDGAAQLVGYLDKNKPHSPEHTTRGYLVVVDGRRAKLTVKTKGLPATHAMKYANVEIEYDPKYHTIRTDFEEPVRWFAEPICT